MNDITIIRSILESWADNTQQGHQDEILKNHTPDALIYDVLPPMKYDSAAAYRASWGDWQPTNVGEVTFALHDLKITAGPEVAFAHAFIHCAGVIPNGKKYEDWVRATFCLVKRGSFWQIAHQHISKPQR